MFRTSNKPGSRHAIATALLAAMLSTSALAYQPPSTGLGQTWPNAADVSVSPHYHVYVFARDGVSYIQVNGLNGTVLGAVAVGGQEVLVLPVGEDAQYVTTSQTAGQGETVYRDSSTQIAAQPADNGAIKLNVAVANATCTGFDCTGQVVTHTQPCTGFDCTGQVVAKPSTCSKFDCSGQVVTQMQPCTGFDCTGQVIAKPATCTKFDCSGQVVTNMQPCTGFDCTGQVAAKTGQ